MVHLQITHLERKSSSIHLHDFGFHVNFPGCKSQNSMVNYAKCIGKYSMHGAFGISLHKVCSLQKGSHSMIPDTTPAENRVQKLLKTANSINTPYTWTTTIRSFQRSAVKGMIVRSIDMRINGDGRKPLSPSNPDRTKRSSSSTDKPLTMSESSTVWVRLAPTCSINFRSLVQLKFIFTFHKVCSLQKGSPSMIPGTTPLYPLVN